MSPFWLKLSLMPLLLLLVSWTTRRYGPHVAGILTGLPLVSGPVSIFSAMSSGPAFASRSASGALAGLAGVGAFCGAYAWASRRSPWPRALACGLAGFLAISVVVQYLAGTLGASSFAACAVLALVRVGLGRVEPSTTVRREALPASSSWELPARIVLATSLVLTLTAGSEHLGPRLSGVCSTIPVLSTVVAVFAHARDGARAVRVFLTGVAGASIGTVGFFAVIGGRLTAGALISTYAMALAAAVFINVLASKLVSN